MRRAERVGCHRGGDGYDGVANAYGDGYGASYDEYDEAFLI